MLFSNFRHGRIFSKQKILKSYREKYFNKVVHTQEYREVAHWVNEYIQEWDKTTGKERFKKKYAINSYQKYTLKVDENILFNKKKTKCIIPILYQMEVGSDCSMFSLGIKNNGKWNFRIGGPRYVMGRRDYKQLTPFEVISEKTLLMLLDDGYINHWLRKIAYSYIDDHIWFRE